jgi:hypothetical protein
MDDSDKPTDEARKGDPRKAEDNPWYLLATLYGVPERGDQELKDKNRRAWNQYFAANLDAKMRARLVEEKRHPAEELTFFPPNELREVEAAFDKRRGSKTLGLPSSDARIDFSNVELIETSFLINISLAIAPSRNRTFPARLGLPTRPSPTRLSLKARPSPARPGTPA